MSELRFPRHDKQHKDDWDIDPAFLMSVKRVIFDGTYQQRLPTMEEIEVVLLALEGVDMPRREWQSLTDEEIAGLVDDMNGNEPTAPFWRDLAHAIESALKAKNGGGE